MTNQQARLIGLPIALLAGALAAGAEGLDDNIGIFIIFVAGILFIAEYVRSQKG